MNTPSLVDELQRAEGGAQFAHDFGRAVASPASLAAKLDAAHAWSRECERAQRWLAYATQQRALAWDDALTALAPLRDQFAVSSARDASVATRYPALEAFVRDRALIATRAAETRRRNARRATAATHDGT